MVFRLLENGFVSRKNESRHFLLLLPLGKTLPQVLMITPQAEKLLIAPQAVFFSKVLPSSRKVREETM